MAAAIKWEDHFPNVDLDAFGGGGGRKKAKKSSRNKTPNWFEKSLAWIQEKNLVPAGGVGFGCGVGLGLGVTGTVGLGAGSWNNVGLVFGVGAGCGAGLGYGIGRGFGFFWDRPPEEAKPKRRNLLS